MSSPHIPQKSPIPVLVEAGKTYYWCSCGHSKNQPFCDGAHKGSTFTPVPYMAPIRPSEVSPFISRLLG
jgi:CDGSH-type Zn-finger protein